MRYYIRVINLTTGQIVTHMTMVGAYSVRNLVDLLDGAYEVRFNTEGEQASYQLWKENAT